MPTYRIEVDQHGETGSWGYPAYPTKQHAERHAESAREQNPEADKVRVVEVPDE